MTCSRNWYHVYQAPCWRLWSLNFSWAWHCELTCDILSLWVVIFSASCCVKTYLMSIIYSLDFAHQLRIPLYDRITDDKLLTIHRYVAIYNFINILISYKNCIQIISLFSTFSFVSSISIEVRAHILKGMYQCSFHVFMALELTNDQQGGVWNRLFIRRNKALVILLYNQGGHRAAITSSIASCWSVSL